MSLQSTVVAALKVLAVLIGAQILGGVLGATADVFAFELISGTPLGASSPLAPIAWTAIALGVLYAASEVLD